MGVIVDCLIKSDFRLRKQLKYRTQIILKKSACETYLSYKSVNKVPRYNETDYFFVANRYFLDVVFLTSTLSEPVSKSFVSALNATYPIPHDLASVKLKVPWVIYPIVSLIQQYLTLLVPLRMNYFNQLLMVLSNVIIFYPLNFILFHIMII
ncbi:unnamed protein product [Leptidea sinapis]|uniref:Uncharacterized protein n=1 Tax=Leptidea sinapis TaxID=189913 RepID=A0A5E4R1J2_9NEOP|nr:unnamed protein product [Leptidea sinapis]